MKQLNFINILDDNTPKTDRFGVPSVLDSNVITYPYIQVSSGGHITPIKYSYIKVIKSGGLYEIFESTYPFIYGKKSSYDFSSMQLRLVNDRTKEYKKRNIKRSLDTIRRLCITNFDDNSLRHITLTFNQKLCTHNINSLKECNKCFSLFITRLRKKYPNVKFVKVAEFQKRGAVHFHVISDLTFVKSSIISKIWGYGFISVSKPSYKISRYLFKYLIKSIDDPRSNEGRMWSASSNLTRSKIYYNLKAYRIKDRLMNINNYVPSYSYTYLKPYNSAIISCLEFDTIHCFRNSNYNSKGGDNL